MCGFAGIARADRAPVSGPLLRAMTSAIAHRGPDGEGFHEEPGVGLGFRRLAIIDLSPSAMQPLANEDGSVWVVFNGEIYNFRELRERLVERGHVFRTRTDSEVLVHLYEEHGAGLVSELRGMFAFAIWDRREQRLVLARDRLGIKPLFVAEVRDRGEPELRFGSEVKALLADPGLSRELDPAALDAYLAQNYVAAPATLLRAVRQLEPGELAVWQGGRLTRKKWWDLSFPAARPRRSAAEWTDALEHALVGAVRSHLVADVPVGALLSGGLDSTTMVAVVAREHEGRTLTFTADFGEATYGEGGLARANAPRLGVENEQVVFGAPTLELIRRVVWHADEPTADLSMLPFFAVCELARRHVTVALSGEGADELFAGYETYTASLVARAYQRVPRPARALVRRAVHALPDPDTKISATQKAKRFVDGAELQGEAAHLGWRRICSPALRRELMVDPAVVDEVPGQRVLARAPGAHPLERMLYVDATYYLPSDMLVKADRMSMAHGLEVRVPYLDHPLVELAASIPPELKLRRLLERKWILREASRRVLPPGIELPRGKKGFNVPMAAWLRGPLREPVRDLLSGPSVRRLGLLRPERVRRLCDEHMAGRDRSFELYGLVALTLWAEHAGVSA
jgi:asparagine synthase (glutamine-hydrolysing)